VSRSYDTGDELAGSAVLPTYVLDRDENRRPPDFVGLRAKHGPCLEVGELRPTGRLRGSWTMRCEHGMLEVTVMLGPILPHRVQYLTVTALR
jgi:hypothetical protein